ncbi:MAG: PEGA domain-containing protein [Myxococcota bacterium]
MSGSASSPASSGSLSREQLLEVLALPKEADAVTIQRSGIQLLVRLETRREEAVRLGSSSSTDASTSEQSAEKLRAEIATLERALVHWAGPATKSEERPAGAALAEKAARDRQSLAGALLGIAFALCVMVAWTAGYRISKGDSGPVATIAEDPATLILVGRLPGATLHVLDADREQALFETPAENARLELPPQRYAIEVRREDCPDRWTRSVFFEAGAEYRYEPEICVGEGKLVVRSNVAGDRLLIDGLDVGSTGTRAHLVGVGDHAVRVEKAGYAPFEGRVRAKPNEEIALRAELRSKGGAASGGKDRAGAEEEPAAGRPLPFSQGQPTPPPSATVKPLPFDVGNFGTALGVEDLGLRPRRVFLRESLGPLPESGSTAWHDLISRQLIAQYDIDGSGEIDQLNESEPISCAVWKEIETDFNRGGLGLSMARYFGFDGSEWHPKALGVSKGHRSAVYSKMTECGLRK